MTPEVWIQMLTQNPQVVARAAQISLEFVDVLAKRIAEGQSKLTLLLQKADQAILREIAAAFEALADANVTTSEATRERLLTLAESNLYNNTKLDRSLTTGGRQNSYWIAQAHYGLALLYALRADDRMASRHTLRLYVADARQGRTELAPKLYQSQLKELCADVFDWQSSEAAVINRREFYAQMALQRLAAGGVGTLGVAGGIATFILNAGRSPAGAVIAKKSMETASQMWNAATPDKYRQAALDELDARTEIRLDIRCRDLAIAALEKI